MKKVILSLIILVSAVASRAQFTTATLQATGLTCAMCSNAINKALKAVSFVESVKSDIPNSAFQVVFRTGAGVDIDALKAAVEDAGFSIGKLELTANFDQLQVANDKHVTIGSAHFHFLNVKEQVLTGKKSITIIDKDFLTAKQFKKISSGNHQPCVATGRSASCCRADGIPENTRVYHATI